MMRWINHLRPIFIVLAFFGIAYWYADSNNLTVSAVDVISAPYAHNNKVTGKGIKIAVIDDGFDTDHPMLNKNFSHHRFNGDFNTWNVTPSGHFENGEFIRASHGTHVSGIIAGMDTKVGVAPEAKLIPIKMGHLGGTQAIIRALRIAQKTKADIVNISMQLSHTDHFLSPNVADALANLADSGKIIVIAAGNSGIPMGYSRYTHDLMKLAQNPRMKGRMIIVGATTYKDYTENLAEFSNFPSRNFGFRDVSYFVTAPGDNITSTVFGGQTDIMSGTSMAAPMVSGGLALLKQRFPELAPEQLVLLILKSARQNQLGTNMRLNPSQFGHGVIDIEAALKLGEPFLLPE